MRIPGFRDGCELVRTHHKPILVFALLATIIGGYFTSKLGLQSDLVAAR
jgi:hypothetical protein